MDLRFDRELATGYKNASQIARRLTEGWLAKHMYCPACGAPMLTHDTNGRPVSDFICETCHADFELKSEQRRRAGVPPKLSDGAYATMIERITSLDNPHLLVMAYDDYAVHDLVLIPKHLFVPRLIEKRPPLSATARRAGWVGCYIDISDVPSTGLIPIIRSGVPTDKHEVMAQFARLEGLKKTNLESRGWLMDVLHCVETIPAQVFTLAEVYAFADRLRQMHPANFNVEAKIRQQLQLLRDKGFLEFLSSGLYRKM